MTNLVREKPNCVCIVTHKLILPILLIIMVVLPVCHVDAAQLGVAFGSTYYNQLYHQSMTDLGVKSININIWWHDIEPEDGVYDYTVVNNFVAQLDGTTIAMMRISARLHPSKTRDNNKTVPRDLTMGGEYYDYVYNVVARTNGMVKYFEAEWEADCVKKHWLGTAEEYAQMMVVFNRAVKDANPDATTIIGAAVGDLLDCNSFTTDVLDILSNDGEKAFDAFDMHLYNHSPDADLMSFYAIPDRVAYYRNLIDSYPIFKDTPIVVTEYGGPSPSEFAYVDPAMYAQLGRDVRDNPCILSGDLAGYPDQLRMFAYGIEPELDAKRDRIQAKQMAQRTLLALSSGVELMHWWNLFGSHGGECPNGVAIRHPTYGKMSLTTFLSPNPTFYAYQTLAQYLAETEAVTRINTGDPDIFLFEVVRADNDVLYVLWHKRDEFSGELDPPTTFSIYIGNIEFDGAFDVYGNPVPYDISQKTLFIDIKDTPVFVERR